MLEATLRATVARHTMFAPGETVVVGASGGPDSTALLHVLAGLRAEWGLTLVAAHLDHGFRGAEAQADSAYVADLCARLAVPCHLEQADVPAMRRRRHLSAQEAAREVRHAFLRRVAATTGAAKIAIAHTRDDRVETVLLNLLRGTGLEGLTALPPVHRPLVRPLIDITREEVEAYCAANALQPRRDSSNTKLDYRRNRLRTELLPYLASYYNEKVDDALLRLADLAGAENALLETLAADALSGVVTCRTDRQIVLNASAMNALPLALRRRVLRQAVASVRGHLQNLRFETVERALEAVAQGQKWETDLPVAETDPIRLYCAETTLRIERQAPPASPLPWQCELQVPGCTWLERAGLWVEARWYAGEALEEARTHCNEVFARSEPGTRLRPCGLFRRRDVALPIIARSRQPGDRIRPRGLGGRKKLQDLFMDAKVPVAERANIPVFVDAGGSGRVLAVVGLAIDESALPLEGPLPEGIDLEGPDNDLLLLLLFREMSEETTA